MLDINSYMYWLDNFTKQHSYFKNYESWTDKLSKEDKCNVLYIRDFFNDISKYANRHSISPSSDDYGYYYIIKYRNVGFRIGVERTYSSYYYCLRLKSLNNYTVINFSSLANDNLNLLAETVEELLNSNIPVEVIVRTFNDALAKNKKND